MKIKFFPLFSHILLITLILISLFLSFNIWFSSDVSNVTKKSDQNAKILRRNLLKDVFLPKVLIWHKQNETNQLIGENILADAHAKFCEFDFKKATLKKIPFTKEKFQQEITESSLEFAYQSTLNLKNYLDIFQLLKKSSHNVNNNFSFGRILINFKKHVIFFINEEIQQAFELEFKNSPENLENLIMAKNNKLNKIPLNIKDYRYEITQPIKLKKYSYMIDNEADVLLRESFFTNNDKIGMSKSENNTRYTGENGETLELNSETQKVIFQGIFESEKSGSEVTLLKRSQRYVEKLGSRLATRNLRFFASSKNRIEYHNFVESFPIFGENNHGEILFSWSNFSKNSVSLTAQMNLQMLQIPVPSNEEVVLPPTAEVVQKLIDFGIEMPTIENLVIGYDWEDIANVKKVINLTPAWFVFYNGQWQNLNKFTR